MGKNLPHPPLKKARKEGRKEEEGAISPKPKLLAHAHKPKRRAADAHALTPAVGGRKAAALCQPVRLSAEDRRRRRSAPFAFAEERREGGTRGFEEKEKGGGAARSPSPLPSLLFFLLFFSSA